MQGVFSLTNDLLKNDLMAARRNLLIRTYKILPLSTNTGVLEWVSSSTPLQEVLQPLHERYCERDWSYKQCRQAIADCSKKSKTVRIENFTRVLNHCQPAMKFAFFSRHSDAAGWYKAQLNYTRSTAVISIVGYVLGLGDRHLHNILLDINTGEVIHIDLGIAFEQGRTLPIPETVPFRLTRDIVDGMGILGVEGVFKRCCEFTLTVMRKEQANIRAILDVLKYDPLYSWTISLVKKNRIQSKADRHADTTDGGHALEPNIGSEAARALLVVEKKLSDTLSASTVINELVGIAMDVERLALLFAGWSAWY